MQGVKHWGKLCPYLHVSVLLILASTWYSLMWGSFHVAYCRDLYCMYPLLVGSVYISCLAAFAVSYHVHDGLLPGHPRRRWWQQPDGQVSPVPEAGVLGGGRSRSQSQVPVAVAVAADGEW